MVIYFKCRKQIITFLFISFILASINVNATECGVLQLQSNRSSGVNIKTNKCKEPSFIAVGTVLDLSAKGRLWLKSTSATNTMPEFHMICQNRTEQSVQLEFSGALSPWLNLSKLKDCSHWVDNKLNCAGPNGEKNGVQCVLSFFKSYKGNKSQKIERTTSVKMRGITFPSQSKPSFVPVDKNIIIESIKPELKLCKKLNENNQRSRIAWIVDQNDDQIEIDIISTEGISYFGFFDCIQTVISTFSYPSFSKKAEFSVDF